MMKGIYVIHDQFAETCSDPIVVPYHHDVSRKHDLGIRVFETNIRDPLVYSNKGDYNLVHVGSYDPESGEVVSARHEIVKRGIDVGGVE